jgi:hypothetical protein
MKKNTTAIILVLTIMAVFSLGCGMLGGNKNTSEAVKSAPVSPPNIEALVKKAEELVKLSPPQKLEESPFIKGKIVVVEKHEKMNPMIMGVAANQKEVYDHGILDYDFSAIRMAKNPEEIDTLIQVICDRGDQLEKNVFAYVCKVSVIDYKNSTVIAQKTFTNDKIPVGVDGKKMTTQYTMVLSKPNELIQYIMDLPLEKLPSPLVEQPLQDKDQQFGKYKSFQNLASEFVRTRFPEKLNPNATIKGKLAVVLNDQENNSSRLLGFDSVGKEFASSDYGSWGVSSERLAVKADELETLITIKCLKGSKLSTINKIDVYSGKCDVSVIDYKAGAIVAKQAFENTEIPEGLQPDKALTEYVLYVQLNKVYEYIKNFPK